MKREKIVIWNENEYSYAMAQGFVPNLRTYIHDEEGPEESRPCMIVVPGGAYSFASPSEGEIIAKKFYDMGYNTFVLTYTINVLGTNPLKTQPMQDLSRAVRYVRANCEKLGIDPEKVVICGFSAGAHLCGSVCVHYQDVADENADFAGVSNRPDAAILSYPVITSGEKGHRLSFIALLGVDATEQELEYYSLEKQVTPDVPPCFVWQTATDEEVPVENSYLFAQALKENGVPFAHHVFSEGKHGMSTADEAFEKSEFGEPYTMEQTFCVTEAMNSGKIQVPDEVRQRMEFFANMEMPKNVADPEVAVWPELAHCWLKKQLKK